MSLHNFHVHHPRHHQIGMTHHRQEHPQRHHHEKDRCNAALIVEDVLQLFALINVRFLEHNGRFVILFALQMWQVNKQLALQMLQCEQQLVLIGRYR